LDEKFKHSFQMDKVLDLFKQKNKEFSFIQKEAEKYKKVLKEVYENTPDEQKDQGIHITDRENHGQVYSQYIEFPNGDYYWISWEIEKLKQVIKEKKIRDRIIKAKEVGTNFRNRQVFEKILKKKLKDYKPIIIIKYPPFKISTGSDWLLVDGNHRIAARYYYGKKGESDIKAFIVNEGDQIKGMLSKLDQTLYKIHFNMINTSLYLESVKNKRTRYNEEELKGLLFSI